MRIVVTVPESYSNDSKGDFFERFVGELLGPMGFTVLERVRFTGMEIDILARGVDQPRTILVECKAQLDPLPADVISKALGNREIRGADAAWIFSTADFSKDGRGQCAEIKDNPELARRFAWFSPERICELLITQRSVKNPNHLSIEPSNLMRGSQHLIVHPTRRIWLVELIQENIPVAYAAFSASSGDRLQALDTEFLGPLAGRLESLDFLAGGGEPVATVKAARVRAPVARVTPGDDWEDLRPARPADFVGREDVIGEIASFLRLVRAKQSSTRTFAMQAPSGWGKSSLTLKIADLAGRERGIPGCSVTAIDSRSATGSSFVAESVQLAMKDAAECGIVSKRPYALASLKHPLGGPDFREAYDELDRREQLIVLIFDQFEELFAKEHLFEAFHAVRELSLDLDAEQSPFVLGFAWKTDISLPQQHPAYHLWHQLSDRRRTFSVPEFGRGEIRKVITKAEKALNKRLSPALRSRLTEQCQGLPWLLKKLLVHVLSRVTTAESQYLLLERELDVEVLFKGDLATLPEGALRCLQYVAQAAPVAVTEVEENFDRDTTNYLLGSRLIVRSGMNYVIYWDIFRDYLLEGRVPQIPWARTFQRDPVVGVRVLQTLVGIQPATTTEISRAVELKERSTQNVLSDLVALQLVDRLAGDRYQVTTVLQSTDTEHVAQHARGQLERHIVAKGIRSGWSREDRMGPAAWDEFYSRLQPGSEEFSPKTVHFYAANLRRWLLFAGLLDQTGSALHRPQGRGSLEGVLVSRRLTRNQFLGTSTPERVVELIAVLRTAGGTERRSTLEEKGLRNAVTDALALQMVTSQEYGAVTIADEKESATARELLVSALQKDQVLSYVREWDSATPAKLATLGDELETFLGATWAESSKRRYSAGLSRFARWLAEQEDSFSLPL